MRRTVVFGLLFVATCLTALPVWSGANIWTPIGPDGGRIEALEVHPRNGQVVYAATRGGVYKSTDGAATWRWSGRGLQGNGVNDLAIARSNPQVIYAATYTGVFLSRDSGETWRATGSRFFTTLSVAVDPRNARHAWVGTSNGLIETRDQGATWSLVDTDEMIAFTADVAVDPVHPDTLYAVSEAHEDSGETGVIKSTDNGATWQVRNDGLTSSFLIQENARLVIDPENPSIVYAALYSENATGELAVFRSADGGANWQETPAGYPVAAGLNGVVYAGGFRSADHGQTWQPIAQPSTWENPALDYAITPSGTLLAGTDRLGVFRSNDQGQHWQQSSKGLHATAIYSFAIDPGRPRVIYAAAGGAGFYKTQSGGAQWRLAENGLPASVHYAHPSSQQLAITLEAPSNLYLYWDSVLAGGSGLAWTGDGAIQWEVRHEDPGLPFNPQMVADPTRPSNVYLLGSFVGPGGTACALARSTDRGATFQCLPLFAGREITRTGNRLAPDPDTPGRLWVLENRNRIWRSDDYGDHWTEIHPGGLASAGEPNTLAIDPVHAGRLYLGTWRSQHTDRPERVWRSDDNGKSWRPWGSGMPEASLVHELLIDWRQPTNFYAAVEHLFDPSRPDLDLSGVYWSRNSGRTFYPLLNGLPGRRVGQLALNPKDPRQLFVAVPANGIYTYTRQ